MAVVAPYAPAAEPMDSVLAAVQQAPLVELTDEERALLAEIEGRPVQWVAHERFASTLRRLGNQR